MRKEAHENDTRSSWIGSVLWDALIKFRPAQVARRQQERRRIDHEGAESSLQVGASGSAED